MRDVMVGLITTSFVLTIIRGAIDLAMEPGWTMWGKAAVISTVVLPVFTYLIPDERGDQ
jgi:hypothetical protein